MVAIETTIRIGSNEIIAETKVGTRDMKFTLVSDLHIDHYPDNQQIDWHVVHRWARADILVIAGNVSDSFHCTIEEILLARQAFRHVVFVDGPCEHYSDYGAPHASDELQRFAEQHDGIHYIGDGPGVLIDHTLVCGIAGWHSLHWGTNRQQPRENCQGRPWDRHDAGGMRCGSLVYPDVLPAHRFEPLAQRVRDAAVDQTIHEIVIVTNMVPHADAVTFAGDHIRDLEMEAACTAALMPIWSDCLDGGKLTTWCFGRSRGSQDFMDNGVRFISNPRGHAGETRDAPYTVRLIDTSAVMDESFEAWA
jgi:hypothetical protein